MKTRIRYNSDNNLLISRQTFTGSNYTPYRIVLDKENLSYKIMNAATDEIVTTGGNTKNLTVLKSKAKNALVSLGVEFDTETRDRTTASSTVNSEASEGHQENVSV